MRGGLVSLALMLVPGIVCAGGLKVGPTLIELSESKPVALVDVRNLAETETLVQVDAFEWAQDGARDVLTPTEELLATPAVLSLKAGAHRTVRVGIRRPNETPMEQSFRLYVREVPTGFEGASGLRFAMRIGVPVFVSPVSVPADANEGTENNLRWGIVRGEDGCGTLRLENRSARRVRVLGLDLRDGRGVSRWSLSRPQYVLAGSTQEVEQKLCFDEPMQLTVLAEAKGRRINLTPREIASTARDPSAHR